MVKRFLLSICIIAMVWVGFVSIRIYSVLDKMPNHVGRWLIVDRYGNTITDLPGEWGYRKPYLGNLSPKLIQNIITIEDRRFFSHFGVDIIAKIGVIRDRITRGISRGGSTLTEQYVKNRYFPLEKRTIPQKLREALWAIVVEIKYSKEDILMKYFDSVYMGNNLYGIGTALDEYFPHETIENLSDDAIVEIITRLRYPNLSGKSEEYKKGVASRLHLNIKDIPLPEREKKEYTDIFPFLSSRIKKEISLYCSGGDAHLDKFLLSGIPHDICDNDDEVRIQSSIDMTATLRASEALEAILYPLEEKNVHNGAILVMDPRTEKFLIYVGNRNDATGNAIDMTRVKRSVGSTLKPFLYLMALHSDMEPDDLILDDTQILETGQEGISYISENYIPRSYGPITLRQALGNSLNSATVRLSEYIGIGHIYAGLRSLGFRLEHDAGYYGYSIMLGGIELSLEDLIIGYKNLTDLSDRENFLLADMLTDEMNRSMTFGVSSILNTSIPLAVKTGTSTDFRDNWAIGYYPSIIIGVWVGNVDRSSMDDVSGVTGAGPLYHTLAEDLIARGYIASNTPTLPLGIESREICLDEKCFQKEIQYTRTGYSRKSRPKSGIYYREDFSTPLTSEEIHKWKIR